MAIDLPMSSDSVFSTIQGEGPMMGVPMIFIRVAGCPVGCPECDTNYDVSNRLSVEEIVKQVRAIRRTEYWVWITGGEPAVYDLMPLTVAIHALGLRVAVVTSGIKTNHNVRYGSSNGGVDFLTVSPHTFCDKWYRRSGDVVNVVPGLNGLNLDELDPDDFQRFYYRYVTPLYGSQDSLEQCLKFVNSCRGQGWRLGIQAHKVWGMK